MAKLRAHNITVSLDGYMAGPDQSLDEPMGVGAQQLHQWAFATRLFRQMHGMDASDLDEREDTADDFFVAAGDAGIGATIMGRNMFGPVRGPWVDESWTGWWGENPPYHHPVFVLTHYPRDPITMDGGTTFHFVDDGIRSALDQAMDAAGGLDVRVGGGAETIQEYLRTGLVDEMHVAYVPLLLGSGERLFDNLDGAALRYTCVETVSTPSVLHARFHRTSSLP